MDLLIKKSDNAHYDSQPRTGNGFILNTGNCNSLYKYHVTDDGILLNILNHHFFGHRTHDKELVEYAGKGSGGSIQEP